jgi:hypothetical protein
LIFPSDTLTFNLEQARRYRFSSNPSSASTASFELVSAASAKSSKGSSAATPSLRSDFFSAATLSLQVLNHRVVHRRDVLANFFDIDIWLLGLFGLW